MSNTNLTVAQLRAEISGHPRVASGDMVLPGLSKFRKADLVELLDGLQSEAQTVPGGYTRITDTPEEKVDSVWTKMADSAKAASAALAGSIFAMGNAAEFTAAERKELNEGKYRGRYEGKTVLVQVGTRRDKLTGDEFPNDVVGRVIDGVHRETDPLNRGNGAGLLLLAVKHDGAARVTLHRAEDVLVA